MCGHHSAAIQRAADRAWLLADRHSLETLLATLPADSVLERLGFESRLRDVNAELASFEAGEAAGDVGALLE
jgi:hypothetical protein